MKTFDGRKGKRLSKKIVGNLRFFGFYIGNETILSGTKWGVKYDLSIIFETPSALGNIFALELFRNYDSKGNYPKQNSIIETQKPSAVLIGEYIESLNNQTIFPLSFDNLKSENPHNWRDVIVRFFKDLGMRDLKTEPLLDYKDDYAEYIINEGNYLEKSVAVFLNVLRMDADFNVINEEWARYRTSQYIRLINDETDTYKVLPPFKEWETMLWM